METEMMIVKYIDMLSATMRQSMREYRESDEGGALFRLTITQLHYLHVIKDAGRITFRDLAEKFGVRKSTVTDIVNRMIAGGLIEKQQSSEDLRVFYLSLTEKGSELLRLENLGYYRFAEAMTAVLTEAEKDQFTQLLTKITVALGAPPDSR